MTTTVCSVELNILHVPFLINNNNNNKIFVHNFISVAIIENSQKYLAFHILLIALIHLDTRIHDLMWLHFEKNKK